MNNKLDRTTENWYLYKSLELLPSSETRFTPVPTFGLDRLWHGLLGLLADELIEEQRVEYLERCLQHNIAEPEAKPRSSVWRQFLKLIE